MNIMNINGWYPKINEANVVASGNSGIYLTYPDDSSVLYSQVGLAPIWQGDKLIFNLNDGRTQVGDEILNKAFNEYVGSDNGRWAGFESVGQGTIYLYSDKFLLRTVSNACAPRLAKDYFAFLTPWQEPYRKLIINNQQMADGIITDIQICNDFYVYQIATGTYTRQILDMSGHVISIRDDEAPLVVFTTGSEKWMVSNTQVGLFIRPLDSSFGYKITGDMYYPDARMIGDRLRVVGSYRNGVARFDNYINFNSPRIDLSKPDIIIDPSPPNKPPVDPPTKPPIVDPPKPISKYGRINKYVH